MANLVWTIVPFVITFAVATLGKPAQKPQRVPIRSQNRNNCID